MRVSTVLIKVAGNGYREKLQNSLIAAGNPVQYVGTQQSGTMANNLTEGYPGLRIEQVHPKVLPALTTFLPNLVLILLGSNGTFKSLFFLNRRRTYCTPSPDCIQNFSIPDAYLRMGSLVDSITTLVPGVTTIIAKLPPLGDAAAEANAVTLNADLDEVVNARPGAKLIVWDMHTPLSVTTDINSDGVHPNDVGFEKIAGLYGDAIVEVDRRGWVSLLPSLTFCV